MVRSNAAVFRTEDGGIRWRSIGKGLDALVWNIVIDPASDATLFAATRSDLFVTTDSGAEWRQGSPSLGLLRSAVRMIVIDEGSPARLRVSTDSGTFASADAGNSWRPTAELTRPTPKIDVRWRESRPNGHGECLSASMAADSGDLLARQSFAEPCEPSVRTQIATEHRGGRRTLRPAFDHAHTHVREHQDRRCRSPVCTTR